MADEASEILRGIPGGPVRESPHPARVRRANHLAARRGAYVLYWMQQSQRAEDNDALEVAIGRANERREPLVVAFGLTPSYPDANLRHYRFLLEGLAETAEGVAARGARFVLRRGDPAAVALELAAEASLVVCDRGYLRHQRAWREQVARGAGCEVVEVEADAVVPVETASDRREWAARTLRPKLRRLWGEHLAPVRPARLLVDAGGLALAGEDPADLDGLLARLAPDPRVGPVSAHLRGGLRAARTLLARFVERTLAGYVKGSNEPSVRGTSGLSPYLHFGQLSPREVALAALAERPQAPGAVDAFLEQLLVRRELACNFAWFESRYDRYEALPDWARATLDAHRADRREVLYDEAALERAATHDPCWNAAMRELLTTGSMHNTMRMYWGKKIIEWSATPEEAFRTTLRLNDRWLLDGRDPNSYTSVLWLFGLHDRPWGERPVFGTVRWMAESGLRRKYDMEAYVRTWRAR